MPNWCANSVMFTGDAEALKKIERVLTDERVGIAAGYTYDMGVPKYFDSITTGHTEAPLPQPYRHLFGRLLSSSDFREEDIDSEPNFYGMSAYVGVKWDPSYTVDDVHDSIPSMVSVTFESAWAPPLRGLRVVARTYGVEAEIMYEEPGMDFAGIERVDPAGKVTLDACGPYAEFRYAVEEIDGVLCELEEGTLTEEDLEGFPKSLDEFIERYKK